MLPTNKGFIVMCGLPGAGKSYFISEILAMNEMETSDIVVCSSDNYIEKKAAENGQTYSQAFHQLISEAEDNFWNELEAALKAGKTVFIDRTNLSKKSRKRLLVRCPEDYESVCVYFHCPPEVNAQRLRNRELLGKIIPEDTISRMNKSFEYPSVDEGFSAVIDVDSHNKVVMTSFAAS